MFLGSIKGTEKLTPVVDIKFDKYGVKYGWAGNQFILWIDYSELKSEEKYKEFLNEISNMPIPEKYKNVISKPIILSNSSHSTNAFQKFIDERHYHFHYYANQLKHEIPRHIEEYLSEKYSEYHFKSVFCFPF